VTYFAHSGTPGDKSDWQSLADHLQAVAKLAAIFARPFGMERAAATLGLFHDLGKYDSAFQRRLEGADIRVDHSTAGAKLLIDLAAEAAQQGRARAEDVFMAEVLGYCVLGHHAGLPDKETSEPACFARRVGSFVDRLDPAWKSDFAFDLSELMPDSLMRTIAGRERHSRDFDLSVVARMLFSCLVDADYKDTEAFYAPLEGRQPDRHWPTLQAHLPEFVARFDKHMADLAGAGELNRLRADILAHVRGKAVAAPGLFTLTVPTGGGKTLASLGFALDHARLHGHSRIIYAIPFTSIIDQTAAIFRAVLGDEHVLEHHSAIDEDEQAARRDRRARPTSRDRLKLAMEDWAAPVVVTTNVQFFESLFASRTSRARKLHNIANSVIILDEAQTIPRHLLKPCVRMLDSLAHLFGCTIVLCTATQPALGKVRPDGGEGFREGLDLEGRELAPDPHGLAARLRRTRIERVGHMDNAALIEAIGREARALVIVNSRRHALELYKAAQDLGLTGLVHLTTRQCAAHRRAILADVRARLEDGRPCRVIATSLIEAGVDVDFPRVWRAEAGLDSIIQAAGRCNREGKRAVEDSVVTVFSTPEYKTPNEIAGLVGDMGRMVDRHEDLLSIAAIEDYFGEVYWRAGPKLLGSNIVESFRTHRGATDFAFRAVAQQFRMIESRMEPVIVPWDDKAKKAVDELSVEKIPSGIFSRKLQTYIVQVPRGARELLIRNGHVSFERADLRGDQFAVLKKDSLYDRQVGLLWETPEYLAVEDMLI
jgi:CRISPR-associated endonuclease/helicase Cas3